jgi:UDP-N-acetylglucosamine 2-epimerase (non-hydrolysing)
MNASCVFSDRGTLSEESAVLGFCEVLVRTRSERPEVLETGTIVLGGSTTTILQAMELAAAMKQNQESVLLPADCQGDSLGNKGIIPGICLLV